MTNRLLAILPFLCLVGLSTSTHVYAQVDSCTYIVMEAEGACSAVNAEGTAVCTSCLPGQLCAASMECISTTSSCVLRMLARVQSLQCGDCPLGANSLPGGFLCSVTGPEPTETPDGGDDTPTPTATSDGSLETPTPSETEGGVTATPTDDGTGGTPTPTDDGTGGTPTPTDDGTGGTPTPTGGGTGGTPTPTGGGTGGTPTRTGGGTGGTPTPTGGGTGGTPTRTGGGTGGTPTPTGGGTGGTPTRTGGGTGGTPTPTGGGTGGTPTPTGGSNIDDSENDDGCQAVAPSHTAASWMILIPVLGLIVWRRRQKR